MATGAVEHGVPVQITAAHVEAARARISAYAEADVAAIADRNSLAHSLGDLTIAVMRLTRGWPTCFEARPGPIINKEALEPLPDMVATKTQPARHSDSQVRLVVDPARNGEGVYIALYDEIVGEDVCGVRLPTDRQIAEITSGNIPDCLLEYKRIVAFDDRGADGEYAMEHAPFDSLRSGPDIPQTLQRYAMLTQEMFKYVLKETTPGKRCL